MDVFLAFRFDGGAITEFFFNDVILRGVRGTLQVTVLAMLFGTLLGIVLGVMRVSHSRLLAGSSSFYVWFMRGTPVLIQLLLVHNGLPQALRIIIPPTGNEVIAMLKNTSLAFAIGFVELANAARLIYSVNFKVMELLVVASIWYLVMTTAFSLVQAELEARLAVAERERAIPLTTRVLRALGGGRER